MCLKTVGFHTEDAPEGNHSGSCLVTEHLTASPRDEGRDVAGCNVTCAF